MKDEDETCSTCRGHDAVLMILIVTNDAKGQPDGPARVLPRRKRRRQSSQLLKEDRDRLNVFDESLMQKLKDAEDVTEACDYLKDFPLDFDLPAPLDVNLLVCMSSPMYLI